MPKTSSAVPVPSAAILAGGQSRRLGQDKSRLVLGRQMLLERTIETMQQLTQDVIVVTNDASLAAQLADVRVVSDVLAGRGALSGLHAGLQAARHDFVLVVACDMPFLNLRLLRYMAVIAPGYDAIVPVWRGQVEPLHALYARSCLSAVEELWHQDDGRIVDFYPRVNVRYLEPGEVGLFDLQGLSFFNINTPQDWEQAQVLEKARGKS
jgi:molybdopterin-guanine dinucleotide biosynthesis protein A